MATTRVTITEGTTVLTSSSLVASNMTTDSSMATVPTSPLPVASKTLANTYYKLTHDKSLNIVYETSLDIV